MGWQRRLKAEHICETMQESIDSTSTCIRREQPLGQGDRFPH